MTHNPQKAFLAPLMIGDTLIVVAVLILVFRWGKLGAAEWALVAACFAGAIFFFMKGLRTLLARRKPKPDDPWKPIEP